MSALQGIKVVEFTSYVSGPYAGMLLGDFGADIIKVEPPETGDPFRRWGETSYNATFGSVNRNKKSVTLDLKSPEGKAHALRLMVEADVVIENLRSGALDRLGLGWDAVKERNPRLIYCSITGFGDSGPYADRPGYDGNSLLRAFSIERPTTSVRVRSHGPRPAASPRTRWLSPGRNGGVPRVPRTLAKPMTAVPTVSVATGFSPQMSTRGDVMRCGLPFTHGPSA